MKNCRNRDGTRNGLPGSASAAKKPAAKQPVTLTTSVPNGKNSPNRWATQLKGDEVVYFKRAARCGRVERVDAKAKPILATTDPKGVYVLSGLPQGTYQVTAVVDGTPRSRVKVRTSNAGWTKVDFDLRLNEQRADGVDHMQTDLSLQTPAPGR